MNEQTVSEKCKGICATYRAASCMWVRVFEQKMSQCGSSAREYDACRDFADAAVVDAHERGAMFRATL